jgi:hypothetical protein
MDDNKFWLGFWTLVATVLVALIGSFAVANFTKLDNWEKAVSNGADPMVASCALNIINNGYAADAIICHTLAQNRK